MSGPSDNAEVPVVILCGGQGTRIREASERLPKPLVDIGGKPILWHIMKLFGHHGYRRFILCLGYKGAEIKRYFLDYREQLADFTLRLSDSHSPEYHDLRGDENWQITFAETGLEAGTGARLRRVRQYIDTPTFLMTYGDGVADVDVSAVVERHQRAGTLGLVTAVHPTSRYGEMNVDGSTVVEFNEKPTHVTGWVNGGFFAFRREFLDEYLDDDPDLFLEAAPLQRLARDGQLAMHGHEGFWMGMDTYRDYVHLNELWASGKAPWAVWQDASTSGGD